MIHTLLRHLAIALLLIALAEAVVLLNTVMPAHPAPASTPQPIPHPGYTFGQTVARVVVEAAR